MIILILLFCISQCFQIKKYLYVLQQNGYKFRAFIRNLNCIEWLIFFDYLSILLVFLRFNIYCLLFAIIFNFALSFAFNPKKIKLIYTIRVKRLICTFAFFELITVLFMPLKIILIMQGLAFFVFALSQFAILPFENYIKQKFVNIAKLKMRQSKHLIVIGITGSYGKTTTKNILFQLLSESFETLMTPKNYNTDMGVCKTIIENDLSEYEIFICEMGAKRRGDIAKICDIVSPQYAIITGISYCHLQDFKTLENIKITKFELIQNTSKAAIINLDENSKELYDWTEIEKIALGNFDTIFESGEENTFYLSKNGVKMGFSTNLQGEHIKRDAALAILMAKFLGVKNEEIQARLNNLSSIENRLAVKEANGIKILDNSYNSNPESAKNSLNLLSKQKGRKIAVVCGMVELGREQKIQNIKLGKLCAEVCDFVFIIGKTNRKAILTGLELQNFDGERIIFFKDLEEMKCFLPSFIKTGDNILFENDLPDNYK